MSNYVLNVETREKMGKGNARRYRRDGKVPAVVYGHDAENQKYIVDVKDWSTLLHAEAQLIDLQVDGKTVETVVMKEMQYDYLKDQHIHIDFQIVKKGEKLTTSISVKSEGVPLGIAAGGIIEQQMHEVEIECLPKDLPTEFIVDISNLDVGDSCFAKDLVLPEGVSLVTGDTHIVFYIAKQAKVEVVATTEGEEGEEATDATEEGKDS